MIENFRIRTPRQRRALIALLEKESIEVKELGILAGALNPCQVVSELREHGFEEIIKTEFFERFDRDGKRCRLGRYFIPLEYKLIVQEFLRRDGLATVPQKTKLYSVNQDYKNDDKEKL